MENIVNVDVKLPFSEDRQDAVVGYLLTNNQFFTQARNRIKPTWFINSDCAKIYAIQLALFEKYKRCPTVDEVKSDQSLMLEKPQNRNVFYARIAVCIAKTQTHGLDIIRRELTEWMHSVVFQDGVEKSVKLFNAKHTHESYEHISDIVRKIRDIRFDDGEEIKFDNAVNQIKTAELDYTSALSIGFNLLDQALVTNATHGGLLPGDMTILLAPVNVGKCVQYNTPIIMADGTIKMVQDIKVGEQLMGPDGKPRNVLSTTKGFGDLFKINPNGGGDSFVCNDVHVLSLKRSPWVPYSKKEDEIVNIPLNDYLNKSKNFKAEHKLWRTSLDFSHKELPIPPYILGLWLGDGHSHSAAITTMDNEIKNEWSNWVNSVGAKINVYSKQSKASTYASVCVNKIGFGRNYKNPCNKALNDLALLNNKHIPHSYLTSSRKQRLELLAGIIDTDGHKIGNGTGYEITSKLPHLAQQYAYLARSLGFKAKVTSSRKSDQNGTFGTYYRVNMNGKLSEIPVRLAYKKASDSTKNTLLTGFTVEPVGKGDYYGFTLDGDHLFLLGDFTVTHNTSTMITAIRHNIKAGKKVLFMTHEGRPSDIRNKLFCSMIGCSMGQLLNIYKTPEGLQILERASAELNKYLTYVPYNKAGMTIEDVEPIIRRYQENAKMTSPNGKGYDLLVVDYPAKLTTARAAKGLLPQRVSDHIVYEYYTQLALEYGFHVLCAIQTNREGSRVNQGKEDRFLTMEDVNESWGPMQSATNVISLNRDFESQAKGFMTFFVCKSRASQVGTAVVAKTDFSRCLTHSNELSGFYYNANAPMSDKLDKFLEMYRGKGLPDTELQISREV